MKHEFLRRRIKSRTYTTMRFGIWPLIFSPKNADFFIRSNALLIEKAREFWYGDSPMSLDIEGRQVTRREIELHGGPNPSLTHPDSQRMEWLSRLGRKDAFKPHNSPQEDLCRLLCSRQGDDRWTHQHQNFDFAIGASPAFNAPRALILLPRGQAIRFDSYRHFLHPGCNQAILVLKRCLARTGTYDLASYPVNVDWSRYDFVLMMHTGPLPRFRRPPLPVILNGHDLWPDIPAYQWVLDWLEPDVLLTPYPTPWKEAFNLSPRTRVHFFPFAPSRFFSRPNLDPEKKDLDLLAVGKTEGPWWPEIYAPRKELDRQILALPPRFRRAYSHDVGARRVWQEGPVIEEKPEGPLRFLNAWSEYLGTARFVIFGRLASRLHGFVLGKYYEALASGAVPIFPEVPDLRLLGIKPHVHYIPLSDVEGNNSRLIEILDHYEDARPIAANAVAWSIERMDGLIFDGFDAAVRDAVSNRYPARRLA